MIIRRQGDGDQYGDQRNDQVVRAQAEESRAWFGHEQNPILNLGMISSESRRAPFGIML
jgi:hypothetical protein